MLTPISTLFLFFLISSALGAVLRPATSPVLEPRAYNLVQARTGGVRPEDVVRGGLFVVKTHSLFQLEDATGRPSCDKTVVVPMETPGPGKSTIDALYLTDLPDRRHRKVLAEPYLLLGAPYAFQEYRECISISDLEHAIPGFWWYDPVTLSALPDLFPPLLPEASGSQLDNVGSSHVPEQNTWIRSKENRGLVFTLKEGIISDVDGTPLSPYVGKRFFYLSAKASAIQGEKRIVSGVLMDPGSLSPIPDHVPVDVLAKRASERAKAWLLSSTYLGHYFVKVTVYGKYLKRYDGETLYMSDSDARQLVKALGNPNSFGSDEVKYGYSHKINEAAEYPNLNGKILIPLPGDRNKPKTGNLLVLALSTTQDEGYVSAAKIMELTLGEPGEAKAWRQKQLTRTWWCKVMGVDEGVKQQLERILGKRDFHLARSRFPAIRDGLLQS